MLKDLSFSNPIVQAVAIFAGSLLTMLGATFLGKMGWVEIDELTPWMFATSFLLFFALANSLFSLRSDNFGKYWGKSMYSFLGLGALNALAAQFLSGISISEAGSYKSIYIVVAIGFLVFLSMLNFMKKIVTFAEKEEWNSPRMKNRKR